MTAKRLRLWVDATPLSVGGGVQVAIAFLENLMSRASLQEDDLEWGAVIPYGMRAMLPDGMTDDPRIRYISKRSKADVARIALQLPAMLRPFAPDIVFTVFGPAYFKAHVPHVVGFALPNLIYPRDGILRDAAGPLAPVQDYFKRQLVRRADHHLVETETVRRRLSATLGIDAGRISVIPNGLNPLLARHPATPLPRTGKFAILVPSAYYRHKNLEIIPEVALRLEQLVPAADFEFRMTLPEGSAPLAAIQREAASKGVGERVSTLGVLRLDGLAQAYREASAVMLPTLREASTAVYPESFHFARPLVTSDMDFTRELCADAAMFASSRDASDYAMKLAELIRTRQEGTIADELVAAGRRRLATSYPSPEEKFERTVEVLRRIAIDRRTTDIAA